MVRLLALALAATGAVVAWFVLEVWRIGRGIDVTPSAEPTDEKLDRLAYDVPHGMPTTHGDWAPGFRSVTYPRASTTYFSSSWGSLSDSDIDALNRGLREVQAGQLVPWRSDNLTSVRPDLTSVRPDTYSRLD